MSRKSSIWLIVLAVVVIAIGIFVYVFQWNWLKAPLQNKLSTALGEQVTIDGNIQGHLGGLTRIDVDHIRMVNPSWKGSDAEKQFATIEDFSLTLDLKRLLTGRLYFPEIIITKPNLVLRRGADGTTNYSDQTKETSKSRASIPQIDTLRVTDGHLDYRDEVKKLSISGVLSTIEGRGGDDSDDGLTIKGDGVLQGSPLIIKAKGGPLTDLTKTSKPYPIALDLTVAQTHFKLDGAVTDPSKLTALDANLLIEGANTDTLFVLLNIPAPESPPYRVQGHLIRDGKMWKFEKFKGRVGDSDLEGTLDINATDRLFIKGSLASSKLDFNDIGPLIGIPRASKAVTKEQKQGASSYHADERILPDAKLSFGKVRTVDVDVTYKAISILAPSMPLDNVDLHVILDHGVLSLKPLKMGVASGLIDANIVIDGSQDIVQTDYDIHLRNFQISRFMSSAGFPNGGEGKMGGRIQLHAPGNSIRESLGNANGKIGVVMNKGQISDLAVALIGLDIGEAAKVTMSQDKLIPIRCIAADYTVADGLMTPKVFVIDTESTLIQVDGPINLKNEKLDLQLKAEQKSTSLLALPTPIDITGRFKHPSIGLDTESLVKRGAAALALSVVLTPIGSLLAFIDPGTAEDSDCASLIKETKTSPSGVTHP